MTIEQKISELLSDSEKLAALDEQKTVSEEIELDQIDELRKSTLASYVKKASVNALSSGVSAGGTMASGDYKKGGERLDKGVKRTAGISKAVDRLAKEELEVDVSEDVNALVNGEELSEEFKAKAATIFEAAVVTRVKQELAKLEEGFDVRLNEEVEIIKEGLVEKVDGYLNYVVEQWMNDNELALESGMKNEIMESFVAGMKNVFEQHYIEVPEEKFDVLGGLQEEVESTKTKLDEQFAINVELSKQVAEMKRVSAIKEAVAGMTDLEQEKFSALAEELSYEDSNTFVSKLQTIKENYFGKKATPVINSVVTDSPVTLTEEVVNTESVDPKMAGYLRALGGMK